MRRAPQMRQGGRAWLRRIIPPVLVAIACLAGFAAAEDGRSGCPRRHENRLAFMMISAWHLAPYSESYLDHALRDIAKAGAAGIVYATSGELTEFFARKGLSVGETAYNTMIYRMAARRGARLWLQLRVYANRVPDPASGKRRNFTAREILRDRGKRQSFLREARREFSAYNRFFRDACRVILFEEAGIYHSPGGGGRFWSSRARRLRKRTVRADRMFASRMARMTRLLKRMILRVNPSCKVGIHLGHSAFLDLPVLTEWMRWLERKGARPDFIFYDFYLKSQKDFASYERKLSRRADYVKNVLKLPFLHLAQLHTMNAFQHGGGLTPSKAELDAIAALDDRLCVDGMGFYTKNALPTQNRENAPLAPNTRGQGAVLETSKERWDYGLRLLRRFLGR